MRKIMLNGRWELAEAGKDTLCAVRFRDLYFPDFTGPERLKILYRTNEDVGV